MKAFVAVSLCFAVLSTASAGFIGESGGNRESHAIIGHGPVSHGPIESPAAVIPIGQGGPLEQSSGGPTAIVAAGPSKPRLHEIHTHSAKSIIRVEEYARPNQVIRVHEAPQAPPEIIKVRGPSEPQSLIRVVAKSSGPAHIERVVHRSRGVQVINVQKPAGAPARIVHVVREAAPAPKVEFINEPERQSHIYVAQSPAGSEVVLAPRSGPGAGIQEEGGLQQEIGAGGQALLAQAQAALVQGPVIAQAAPQAIHAPISGPVGHVIAAPVRSYEAAPQLYHSAGPIQAHGNIGGYGGPVLADVPVRTKIVRKYHH